MLPQERERLQQILLFRALEFPLKEIKEILYARNFDRNKALEQQIELLQLKKEHLEKLITFARGILMIGGKTMDFSVLTQANTENIDNVCGGTAEFSSDAIGIYCRQNR